MIRRFGGGLRARVLVYLLLATLVSSGLTVVVALVLADRAAVRDRVDALERRADDAEVALGTRGAPGSSGLRLFTIAPRGGLQQPLLRRGRPEQRRRAQAIAAALGPRGPGSGQAEVGGRDLLYVRRDTRSGPIAVVRPKGRLPGDAAPLAGLVIAAGAGGAIVAALVAFALASRLLRTVRDLEGAMGSFASGQTGARARVHGDDELAALARSFNAMADDLVRSQAVERRFVHAVSHELRTPLTAISGYAEALGDGAVTSGEAVPVLRAEAARLERLVADLLELARVGASGFSVRSEPVDLGRVLLTVNDRFALRAERAAVALEVDAAPGAAAAGDFDRVVQAVANLVDNALRVTPAGGRVRVDAGGSAVTVTDSGPSLGPEELARVFDPFSRPRTDAAGEGSGLGLPIVRALVQAMGGTVHPAAGAQGGVRVTITLPPPG